MSGERGQDGGQVRRLEGEVPEQVLVRRAQGYGEVLGGHCCSIPALELTLRIGCREEQRCPDAVGGLEERDPGGAHLRQVIEALQARLEDVQGAHEGLAALAARLAPAPGSAPATPAAGLHPALPVPPLFLGREREMGS